MDCQHLWENIINVGDTDFSPAFLSSGVPSDVVLMAVFSWQPLQEKIKRLPFPTLVSSAAVNAAKNQKKTLLCGFVILCFCS